jgi:hypothetical protein
VTAATGSSTLSGGHSALDQTFPNPNPRRDVDFLV